ncbi:hypothetical protein V6N12_037589 [Hibiscus sabdariffa]|uniref:Uncharacterized protein n=1 Tax=Hibiscus sabdariffa TaxID=183260 RepID=A0ABR2C2X7_9ROSI
MELEWKCRLSGVVLVSFVNKLHALKVYLKVWNRETFGSVDLQIEVVSGLLNALDERGMAEGMQNSICGLHINGRWMTADIIEALDRLDMAGCIRMEEPFTQDEVWQAIRDGNGLKTLSLDGYNLEFYKWG